MGKGWEYKCEKCNEEYFFYLGVGMLYNITQEELEKKVRAGNYGKKRKKKLEENPLYHISAVRKLYVCPICHKPKVDYDLSVVEGDDFFSNDKQVMRYAHRCSKCKVELKSYTTNTFSDCKEDLHCPKCNGLLKDVGPFLWD